MAIPWENLFKEVVRIFIYNRKEKEILTTMSFIYKITNKKNQKIYIGYTSQDLASRWRQHKYEALTTTEKENRSYLYSAMRYYGIENFKIEKVYEFNEEEENWEELEKHFIKELNTLAPNGYNLLEGGNKPPVHYGNDNTKTKLTDEELPFLIEALKDTSKTIKQIAKEFDLSVDQVSRINQGENRKIEGFVYPIRKYSQNELYVLEIMNLLSTNRTLSNSKIANMFPCYFRANEIASINTGKKYAYLWEGTFPIRTVLVPDDYEVKQDLAKKIIQYIEENKATQKITQKGLQEKFNIGRSIIEKIIKGIYPYSIENFTYPITLNK